MALFVNNYTNLGPTPVTVNPAFPKPMTQVLIVASPDTSNDQVIVTVGGQNIPIGEGILLKLEQPGPFQLSGTSGLDSAYVVCMQSDNYQLTGRLVEIEAAAGGGGGGTTYTADGVTLELTGTTFSIKNNGVDTAQLANDAVGPTQLDAAVAGAGLSGGSGLALAVNVDNSTIEIPVDTLQVKALGIGSGQLANGAVTTGKLNNQAVTYPKMGVGTERVPLCSGQVTLDVAGQPIAGEQIRISVTDSIGTVIGLFEADGAGPFDFAIGASAADTLNNLIVAALAFFATSRSQLQILPNAGNDFALLSVANAQPTSGSTMFVDVTLLTLTNYTKTDLMVLVQAQSRIRSNYHIAYQVAAADVGRGYIALRGDTNSAFSATATPPWVFARTSAGAMKPLGCTISYDPTLVAWVITNNGTNDFVNLDELLIFNFLDT